MDHDSDGCVDGSSDEIAVADGGTAWDCDGDGSITPGDDIPAFLNNGTTLAITFDNNNPRCSTAASMKSALITAIGESEDGLARRTVSQCVGTRNLFEGDGPKQSLVSGSTVSLTGSAQLINRFSDYNVWSADAASIDGSSAMQTFIRPPGTLTTDYTREQLLDSTTSPDILYVQEVSNKTEGLGSDIYMDDPRLNQSADDFMDLFFLDDGSSLADIADINDQKFTADIDDSDIAGKTDVIYVDNANASLTNNGTIVGTIDQPVLMIIDGDLDLSGGTYTGLIYVTGSITINGNPKVVGTIISKGSVSGTGALTLVYAENIFGNSDHPIKGTTGIIAGSWRDW